MNRTDVVTDSIGRAIDRAQASVTAGPPSPTEDLDALARHSPKELEERFRRGRVPGAFSALDGSLPGRLLGLAWPGGSGLLAGAVRRLAGSAAFPWRGKTFQAPREPDLALGLGRNRVRLGRTFELFPFVTRIEPSLIDGEPAVLLDYDVPENPRLMRRVRDELREVAPGLFLGPGFYRLAGRPRLVLFFGVDARGTH